MDLCKYRHIFGKEKEGLHKYRIFGFALIDCLLTFFITFIISYVTKYKFVYVLIVMIILSLIIHELFCVDTKSN